MSISSVSMPIALYSITSCMCSVSRTPPIAGWKSAPGTITIPIFSPCFGGWPKSTLLEPYVTITINSFLSLLGVTSRSDSLLIGHLIQTHQNVGLGANYLHLAAQLAISSTKSTLKAIKLGFGLRSRAEIRTKLDGIGIRDPMVALALIQDPEWAESAANNDDQRQFIRSLLHYSPVGVQAVTYAVMPDPDIPYYITAQLEHDLRQRP